MESWRLVWREGFAPQFAMEELRKVLAGLLNDDPRIIQGGTTTPPPLQSMSDQPVEAVDVLVYGRVEWGESTVGECEEVFARRCFDCDQKLGEPAACRWWLNWYDDTPRDEMRREVIEEVKRELWKRLFVHLDPLLAAAMMEDPGNTTLRMAVSDYLREQGDEEGADAVMDTP